MIRSLVYNSLLHYSCILVIIYLFIYSISLFIDGPIFKEHTNSTVWTEFKTGSSGILSCIVIDSNPPIITLNVSYPRHVNGSNWSVKHNGTDSLYIIINNASQMNHENYTCYGTNGHTSSQIVYQTFVGGSILTIYYGHIMYYINYIPYMVT